MSFSVCPSVEALAHITAPSGAKDDADYRAQAAACLDFQPVSRLRVYHPTDADDDGDDGGNGPLDAPASVQEDSQETTSSSSLSGTADPAVTAVAPAPAPAPTAPPRSSPIKISLLSSSEEEDQDQGQVPDDKPTTATTAVQHEPADESSSCQTPPSTVPDSQPAADVDNNNHGHIRYARDRGHDQDQDQPHPKKPRLDPPPPRSPQPPAPAHPKATAAPDPSSSSSSAETLLTHLPLQIRPPAPPPSSTTDFSTHITPTLRMLAARLSLQRVFRPAMQTRPLRPLERGCWVLRIRVVLRRGEGEEEEGGIWSSYIFARFWNYLRTFVGARGHAGWGVWCHCEVDTTTTTKDNNNNADNNNNTADDDGGEEYSTSISLTVRVYTWGETAPHIYLLLYLASEKRVKRLRSGVEWRDGAEQCIIRMH